MTTANYLYNQTRADVLGRLRSYTLLVALALMIALTYFFVPADDASYVSLILGSGYRGLYNSAWIGASVTRLSLTWLTLIGFYVVKGNITQDEHSGVGQIIASTQISKPTYIFGKWLSNFIVILSMIFFLIIATGAMQLIRAEDMQINLWDLTAPLLIILLPVMALVSALAVLFETITPLRGSAGNILYFFLIAIFLSPTVLGAGIIEDNMFTGFQQAVPGSVADISCCLIFKSPDANPTLWPLTRLNTFIWTGIEWTSSNLLGRLWFVGFALSTVVLAAGFFDRFDTSSNGLLLFQARLVTNLKLSFERRWLRLVLRWPRLRELSMRTPMDRIRSVIAGKWKSHSISEGLHQDTAVPAEQVSLSSLTATKSRFSFGSTLMAELRLMLKGHPWWWYLGAAGLVIASSLTSLDFAYRWLLPLAWVWPMAIWSAMGTREKRHRTDQIIFSSPRPILRQLPATWLAGFVITGAMGSVVLIRLLLAADGLAAMSWLAAALFIPSLALALGIIAGRRKVFEIVYLVIWYGGPMNQVKMLDFMFLDPVGTIDLSAIWLVTGFAIALMVLALFGRQRQLIR